MCYVSKIFNEKSSGNVKSIKLIVEYELENGLKKTVFWDMENINIDESRDFDVDTGRLEHKGLSIDGEIKAKEDVNEDE